MTYKNAVDIFIHYVLQHTHNHLFVGNMPKIANFHFIHNLCRHICSIFIYAHTPATRIIQADNSIQRFSYRKSAFFCLQRKYKKMRIDCARSVKGYFIQFPSLSYWCTRIFTTRHTLSGKANFVCFYIHKNLHIAMYLKLNFLPSAMNGNGMLLCDNSLN